MIRGALLLLFVAGCPLTPDPKIQRCDKQWLCGNDVRFERSDDLCVDANDADAVQAQADSVITRFADTCDNLVVTCGGASDRATCAATCTLTTTTCPDAGP